MPTVPETELEQKISEFIQFVRDFSANKKGDYKFRGKREGFVFHIIDGDVNLDFSI